jgi:probable F420-dependent oxidoreductase
VKVRIGCAPALGGTGGDPGAFGALVDGLEDLRFDSLWLPERIGAPRPDAVVGMAFAAGRTRRLKVGTSVMVLPGRNPVLLAKELATLDVLSGGRVLPAFGLGVVDRGEQQAFGVERSDRAARFDETLALLRRFWTEYEVSHDGRWFHYDAVRVEPKPVQRPLDVWLGGRAPGELRRVGRVGDGWLPSFCTPADVVAGQAIVRDAATAAGRAIDPEHWGAMVFYASGAGADAAVAALAARLPASFADHPLEDVVVVGHEALAARVEEFVAVGFSKLVVAPIAEPADWDRELAGLADVVLPLQRTVPDPAPHGAVA